MSLYLLEAAKLRTAKRRSTIAPLTPDDLYPHLKIVDKNQQVIPYTPKKVQKHLAESLTGRDIVLKSRKVGVSTFIRARHDITAMTQRASCLTIAHDSESTANLRRMSKFFWNSIPSDIRPPRATDNATTTIYENTGSEVIIRTAGSSEGTRSFTFSKAHCSEVAFWKDAKTVITALINAMPIDSELILESTPNGAQGYFFDEVMRSLRGESVFKVHFYEWWWDEDNFLSADTLVALGQDDLIYSLTDDESALVDKHGLTQEQIYWRRYKIKEDPIKFFQEYPEDIISCFLTSSDSFFGDLSDCFTAPLHATYDPQYRYIAGLDFGQHKDYTALIVINRQTYEVVDILHINQLSWEDMRARVIEKLLYWRCPVIAESNSAGGVNIEAINRTLSELKPQGAYDDLSEDGKILYDTLKQVRVVPFKTTARSKPPLIQGLYTFLHEMSGKLLDNPLLRGELMNFTSFQTDSGHWKYEAANDGHDDLVIALALAVEGLNYRPPALASRIPI